MSRVTILEDDWLVFRSPEAVTNRQRRPFRRASAKLGERAQGSEDASRVLTSDPDFAEEFMAALAFMIIVEWSFPVPVFTDWDLFCDWVNDSPAARVDAVLAAAWAHHVDDSPEVEAVPPKKLTPKKPKVVT